MRLKVTTAYGFVKHTGGEILLKSGPGKGTRVSIFLHRSNEAPALPEQGSSVTVTLLSALGYQVLAAATPVRPTRHAHAPD